MFGRGGNRYSHCGAGGCCLSVRRCRSSVASFFDSIGMGITGRRMYICTFMGWVSRGEFRDCRTLMFTRWLPQLRRLTSTRTMTLRVSHRSLSPHHVDALWGIYVRTQTGKHRQRQYKCKISKNVTLNSPSVQGRTIAKGNMVSYPAYGNSCGDAIPATSPPAV